MAKPKIKIIFSGKEIIKYPPESIEQLHELIKLEYGNGLGKDQLEEIINFDNFDLYYLENEKSPDRNYIKDEEDYTNFYELDTSEDEQKVLIFERKQLEHELRTKEIPKHKNSVEFDAYWKKVIDEEFEDFYCKLQLMLSDKNLIREPPNKIRVHQVHCDKCRSELILGSLYHCITGNYENLCENCAETETGPMFKEY